LAKKLFKENNESSKRDSSAPTANSARFGDSPIQFPCFVKKEKLAQEEYSYPLGDGILVSSASIIKSHRWGSSNRNSPQLCRLKSMVRAGFS
jgi:hypothetical protein